MFSARIPFRQLVAFNTKRMAMRKRSMYNAIVVFAITLFSAALMPSTAKAQPACDAVMPRLKAIAAVQFRLVALIRRTGDCSSYLPELSARRSQFKALSLGAGCQYSGLTNAQNAATLRKYCRTNAAQKPQAPKARPTESASQKPAQRQEIAKVQPETRPSKPSTQMPAPVNENAQRFPTPTRQGRPLPVEAGARHLRSARAEAFPEQSGTAPANASALPERPSSPGPSNAQNSCSGGPGTPGCIPGSAPPTPQYLLTDSTPKPTPSLSQPPVAPWLEVIATALFGALAEAEPTDSSLAQQGIEATPGSDSFEATPESDNFGEPDTNTQKSSDPSFQSYPDYDPRSHGVLGPNDYPRPVPPEPSWWTQQEWQAEQWAADRWNNFKQNLKSLGQSLGDWFWN